MLKQANVAKANKLYKKGEDALKTSYFSFKFSPDYLSAVHYFQEAANEYKQIELYKESIKSYEEAIKCNKQLNESWAQGQNYNEMANIYIFKLNEFDKGWQYLQNACMSYKIEGKFSSGIKLYLDASNKLTENKKYNEASILLKSAFEDCAEQTQDELIRISLEESYSKLLDIYCCLENYPDAIRLVESYIKIQKSIKEEKKYKISQNYLKFAILNIINGEAYMAKHCIDDMYSCYDSSSSDDIDDLKKLINAFETVNKKDFDYLMTYSFSLFQNNLLKGLKKAFEKKIDQSSQYVNIQNENNNINQIIQENDSLYNETKADSEIVSIDNQNNYNPSNHSEDYL